MHQLSQPHIQVHQNWRATRKQAVLSHVMERSEITLSDRTRAARWSCGSTRRCCGIDLLLLLLLAWLVFMICLGYVLLLGIKDLSDQTRVNNFSPFLGLSKWQWLDFKSFMSSSRRQDQDFHPTRYFNCLGNKHTVMEKLWSSLPGQEQNFASLWIRRTADLIILSPKFKHARRIMLNHKAMGKNAQLTNAQALEVWCFPSPAAAFISLITTYQIHFCT